MYELPPFLEGVLTRQEYVHWLQRRSKRHVVKDRGRWNDPSLSNAGYKIAIHKAVLDSGGTDFYTGEELDWALLRPGVYDSKVKYDRDRRREFRLRPAVDHLDAEPTSAPTLVICADRTNRCKSDLTVAEMRVFCRRFLRGTEGAV